MYSLFKNETGRVRGGERERVKEKRERRRELLGKAKKAVKYVYHLNGLCITP